jgi:hypothetical protein
VSDAVPVLWLEQGDVREDAVRALDAWARTRGVELALPRRRGASPVSRPPEADPSVADRVEKELDRARAAVSAEDADATERALARAEALLRAHPELPQAAWLRAEVERAWSVRWLRVAPRDAARARAAWEAADGLDGGRVAGVGETAFPPPPRSKVRLLVGGARPGVVLRVDGRSVEPSAPGEYDAELAPGEHQVVVTAGARVAFASWVALAGARPEAIRVDVDDGACEEGASVGARVESGVVQASGVGCARWIAAVPGARRGAVLVARCERDACGPLLEWRMELLPERGVGPERRRATWPSWATWTLVGAGAVSALAVGLVATGALETRPVVQRFVTGGVREE